MLDSKYLDKALITVFVAAHFFLCGLTFKLNYDNKKEINRFKQMSYQEAIAEVKTPEKAKWYITQYIKPTKSGSISSFRITHKTGKGDCAEAVVAAAALLSDNGFSPNYLIMTKKKAEYAHAAFFYESKGKYGVLGINDSDNYPPVFSNLDDLVRKLGYDMYYAGLIGEGVIPDWITTSRDMCLTKEEIKKVSHDTRYKVLK